jgi:hypothetical protein
LQPNLHHEGAILGSATEIRRVAFDLQDLLLRAGLASVTANFAVNFDAADLISEGGGRWDAHLPPPSLGKQLVRRFSTMFFLETPQGSALMSPNAARIRSRWLCSESF